MAREDYTLVYKGELANNPNQYIGKRVAIEGELVERSVVPLVDIRHRRYGFGGLLNLGVNSPEDQAILLYFEKAGRGGDDSLNAIFSLMKHLEGEKVVLKGILAPGRNLNLLLRLDWPEVEEYYKIL